MALGDESTLVNRYAVRALRWQQGADVERYLEDKLKSDDAQLLMAAVSSYAYVAGGRALPALVAALQANQSRADGNDGLIRTEIVRSLGLIGTRDIVAPLAAELSQAQAPNWDLEYGSAIVSALGKVTDRSADATLNAYVSALQTLSLADPLAKSYLESKITEAQGGGGVR
jgi:hypothetical protein